MVDFNDVVKTRKVSCKTCLSLWYTLPCRLDEDLITYLSNFGKPVYPIKTVKLLRINSKDGYKIDGKVGKNAIKFALPKHLEKKNLDKASRKLEFEKCLKEWMTNKLDITIE